MIIDISEPYFMKKLEAQEKKSRKQQDQFSL